MKFRKVSNDFIEIIPGPSSIDKVLEEIARVSYELASTIPPWFIQPFDIPVEAVDFSSLVQEDGLRLDYLNGRFCSTYVVKKGEKYLFDAKRFREDRGSPEMFLSLVQQRLEKSRD